MNRTSGSASHEPDFVAERKNSVASALKAVTAPTVVDTVTQQLLGLIRAGILKPGDQLPPENELAARLKVGRSTIREVKRVLGARGLLEFRGKQGSYIAQPESGVFDPELLALLLTRDTAEHLHEARSIVEVGAVRVAAVRITDEQISALDLLLRQLTEQQDRPEIFWPGTVEFHNRLIAATANPVIVRMHGVLADTTVAYQMPMYQVRSDPAEVVAIHRKLLDAVATRDPDEAAQEMIRHLDESHHALDRDHSLQGGNSLMPSVGRRQWVIADGWIPPGSTGTDPALISHEAACILNAGETDAQVSFTVFFTDAEPQGPTRISVPARRAKHQNLAELPEPVKIPVGTDYCVLIESDVPVVVQHTRLDSRQAENALMTTIAYPGE